MSKLPISAFHPSSSYEAHIRNLSSHRIQDSMKQNLTLPPTIILSGDNLLPTPVTLCVDGVLLWLLLAWITAGTAAIITLIVRACRNKWKQFDEEEFDWGGLNAMKSRSSQHTRSTSCSSSTPSFRHIPKPTHKSSNKPPTTPSPPRLGHRISTRLTSSRRAELMDNSRRYKQHRSRRLQSTTA